MKYKKYKPKSESWFKKRIGKTIFRDVSTCDCETCRDVEENGLIVYDENHAGYLAMIDMDYAAEGTYMNYRDNK